MADDVLMLRGWGNVDVQVGGPGNPWLYLSACAALAGVTIPKGETERRWCQDPTTANGFKVSSKFRTAPDQISGELMTKLGKVNYLDKLDCPFSIRARFADCGERDDPSNYTMSLSFCNVDLTELSYEDLVVTDPSNQDEILVTTPWTADYDFRIEPITGSRIGSLADVGDQAINDIDYCSEHSCGGTCGSRTDQCSAWYAITDADSSPYAYPNLIKGVRNVITDIVTWTNKPIIGVNSALQGIECAGARLLVSSNGDSVIGYNDNDGDQDEWSFVTLTNAPSATPNALFARTAKEIWVAANNGILYKSVDGGTSFDISHNATLTSENLNAVYAFNKDLIYAVGDNGVIIKSTDGGSSWVDLTETSTTSANLLSVVVPDGRPREVFIGGNNGNVYKSTDEGVTFAQMSFAGDGVGTIDSLAFCGPCAGEVLWILQNDAGPRGRVLRDMSGGNGGPDVENAVGYTEIVTAGVDLNALACCGTNEILAAGAVVNGYPVIVRTS